MASLTRHYMLLCLLLTLRLCYNRCENNEIFPNNIDSISDRSKPCLVDSLPRLPEDIFHDLSFLDTITRKELNYAQKQRILNADVGIYFPQGFVNSNKENNILCKSAMETLHLFYVGTIPLVINCDIIIISVEKEMELERFFYLITQREGNIIDAELMASTDEDIYSYYTRSKRIKNNNYRIYHLSNKVIKEEYNLLILDDGTLQKSRLF